MIRTVNGDIDPSELGFTYSHEHLLGGPPPGKRADEDLVILDREKAFEEAATAVELGVDSLFEASAWDYSRDVVGLREVASRTGLQIIACGGFNKGQWFDDLLAGTSIEDLAARIIVDITSGMDGTDIRGGVIKYGTSYNRISRVEENVLRAAARAHRVTGAPLHGHTEVGTMALDQLDLLESEGVNLTHVGIVHLMRNPDPYVHRKIASRGAYLCYDGFAKIKYFPESVRIRTICDVVDSGLGDRILIGGDLARRSDLFAYTGGPGLRYIAGSLVPRMREEFGSMGYSESDSEELLQMFFVSNPRAYFNMCEPY